MQPDESEALKRIAADLREIKDAIKLVLVLGILGIAGAIAAVLVLG